ncbi:LysR family transcriptional regulator [Marinobacterium lutimaris]|uniref:DNA-binding transcriptional regulator, LysR family n=1 Tax=Marinobacterium lutimaris TaxID=568106 RepID=A0A1H5VMA8_9GAMM|nr:LysR family transcriptional regulator [Marinobacterium lutimaris]SEF88156.1 DNA-binding transcriptional regulator, LysR family [Marinobacterium lutimaris]
MTNEQLRAFIAVVEWGSFRAAGSHLFKTQSSVSASVRVLEEEFGLQLFDRSHYRPQLTSEGRTFYHQARKLLSQADELEQLGHRLAADPAPTLSIALSAMCSLPPGLDIIRRFCSDHPELRLHIQTEHLSGVLEQLHLETAEIAIGPHRGLDQRYEFAEISRIQMITVAAPGFVPDLPEGLVPQSVLRSRPHILITDSGSQAPFDHVNVIPGGHLWYVTDYQMKKALLLAEMGWARIPAHMVEQELASGELIQLQIENFPSESEVPIYLIRLNEQPLSREANALWQELLKLRN